jgi:hypothetical protein
MKQQTFKPQPVKRLGARMGYTLIEFLVGIVTIVGFMYKFEKDTRSELRAELRTNIEELRSEMRSGFNRLANVITSANEITIE